MNKVTEGFDEAVAQMLTSHTREEVLNYEEKANHWLDQLPDEQRKVPSFTEEEKRTFDHLKQEMLEAVSPVEVRYFEEKLHQLMDQASRTHRGSDRNGR